MSENRSTILITDMSRCLPSEALTRGPRVGCWRLLDYELEDGTSGIMAYAVPGEEAPEITLPLDAKGIYKIYLGINYTKNHFSQWGSHGQTKVRLSSDEGSISFGCEASTNKALAEPRGKVVTNSREIYKCIHEVYWKTAALDGESMHISPMGMPYSRADFQPSIANISCVKLVPADDAHRRVESELEDRTGTANIAALWCGGALTGNTSGMPMYHPTDEQWFRDEVHPFTASDVGIVSFEVLRGNLCLFRSAVGDIGREDNDWPDDWVDPLRAFVDVAHRNEILAFVSLRMIGPTCPVVINPISRARHYWAMQEFAKRDAEGLPMSNLSVAFPEVRQHWMSLLRETLAYGADGLTLYFNRCVPMIYYEKPVLDSFLERFGVDPRALPEEDPRWQRHAAGFITNFVRGSVRFSTNSRVAAWPSP